MRTATVVCEKVALEASHESIAAGRTLPDNGEAARYTLPIPSATWGKHW
jgi:hypothetical protein